MCTKITLGSALLDYKYGENRETHPYTERSITYITYNCPLSNYLKTESILQDIKHNKELKNKKKLSYKDVREN